MESIRQILGFNLRLLRGDRTQAELAEVLGLPLRSYQRIESGVAFPQESTLKQITTKLGVSESALFQDQTAPALQTRSSLLGEIVTLLAICDEDQLRATLARLRLVREARPKGKNLISQDG